MTHTLMVDGGLDEGTAFVAAPGSQKDPLAEVSVFRGTDGALVIQVDTNDDTGRIRVNVNDGPVFDGDCVTGERHPFL